jgi:hypothetical protein
MPELEQLPLAARAASEAAAPLPPEAMGGVPLLLCAHAHCTTALRQFADRFQNPDRPLTATDSIGLEPSQLLSAGKRSAGWTGPTFALVTPRCAAWQALRWALAVVAAGGVPAAVVCEVEAPEAASSPRVSCARAVALATTGALEEATRVDESWRGLAHLQGGLAPVLEAVTARSGAGGGEVQVGPLVNSLAGQVE